MRTSRLIDTYMKHHRKEKPGVLFFAGSGGFIPESQATQAEMYVYIRK